MSAQLIFIPPADVTPEDIALCERLIDSYHRAMENPINVPGPMWDAITKEHCGELLDALNCKDAPRLAGLLAQMFTRGFIQGISNGSPRWTHDPLVAQTIERLVRLAEYLGIVHVRNPEQGTDDTLAAGLDVLVGRIELELSRSIGFPEVGAPYGIRSAGVLITPELPEQIYVAQRILAYNPGSVIEIGGGYGGLAYFLLSGISGIEDYTIIDLPLAGVLQGYFLMKAIGPFTHGFDLHILPPSELYTIDYAEVMVNQNGMPEMGREAGMRYLGWAKELADLFYSYNHEACAPPQIRVPEIVKAIGGFKRLSRNSSWLRPGYVEEVYGTERNQG